MGPYLTVPRKEKETVDGENSRVRLVIILKLALEVLTFIGRRLNLELVECRAGETQWKMHT
jgi:hypothetical protein